MQLSPYPMWTAAIYAIHSTIIVCYTVLVPNTFPAACLCHHGNSTEVPLHNLRGSLRTALSPLIFLPILNEAGRGW
jgi:hypothetical protein